MMSLFVSTVQLNSQHTDKGAHLLTCAPSKQKKKKLSFLMISVFFFRFCIPCAASLNSCIVTNTTRLCTGNVLEKPEQIGEVSLDWVTLFNGGRP